MKCGGCGLNAGTVDRAGLCPSCRTWVNGLEGKPTPFGGRIRSIRKEPGATGLTVVIDFEHGKAGPFRRIFGPDEFSKSLIDRLEAMPGGMQAAARTLRILGDHMGRHI